MVSLARIVRSQASGVAVVIEAEPAGVQPSVRPFALWAVSISFFEQAWEGVVESHYEYELL